MCVCGDLFDADHAMICMHGGYSIHRHNEIRDLEAEILQALCTDVEMEPVLQKVRGKCCRGVPTRPLTRDWISVRGASGRENSLRSLMLGYATLTQTQNKNLTPEQIYKLHMNDKKRLYSFRVLEVERGTFALWFLLPLEACLTNVNITTTGNELITGSEETGELRFQKAARKGLD